MKLTINDGQIVIEVKGTEKHSKLVANYDGLVNISAEDVQAGTVDLDPTNKVSDLENEVRDLKQHINHLYQANQSLSTYVNRYTKEIENEINN